MVLRLGFYQGHHIRDGHIVLFDLFGNSKGNLPLFEAITEPVRFLVYLTAVSILVTSTSSQPKLSYSARLAEVSTLAG